MARQSSVNAAYAPVNGKSATAGSGWSKLFGTVAVAATILFFLSGSSSGPKVDDYTMHSGQANHAISNTTAAAYDPQPEASYPSADSMLVDEERIETSIDNAKADIVVAETDELEKEQSMLDTAATGFGNSFRISIGRLFGGSLSNEEVEKVTEEVEGKLQEETHNMLRTQAQQSVDREFGRVADIAKQDELSGYGADEIQSDLYEQELQGANAIRDDIDLAAENARDVMKKRAAEIEKEILEERLSQKMGKRVKVVIVDDEVKGIEDDVNNLLQGLNTLAPPPQGGVNAYGMPPQQQSPYGGSAVQQSSSNYGYGMQQPPAQPAQANSYGASVAYGTDPNQYVTDPNPYGSSTTSSAVPPSTGSNYYGTAPAPVAATSSTSMYGSSTATSNSYDTTTSAYGASTTATSAASTLTAEPAATVSTEAEPAPKKSGYSLFGGWSSSSTEETTTAAAATTETSFVEASPLESTTTETVAEEEEEEEVSGSGDW